MNKHTELRAQWSPWRGFTFTPAESGSSSGVLARMGFGVRTTRRIRGGFLFLFFLFFVFYKNIFSIWKFTGIYPGRPAAGRPGPGSPAAGRQGLIRKKKTTKNCRQVPGGRSPGSGAAGLAARLLGDRLSHPYIRVGWSPHPSFASLKFQKPRKKREGGTEAKPCRIFEPATAGNQNRLCCNYFC